MSSATLQIKVCGLTRLDEAEGALALGAHYVGLNLYPKSPRAVTPEQAWRLCQALPAGTRVLVDVDTPTDKLEEYGDLGFDFFQIHCDLDTALASLAAWSGIVGRDRLWLAVRLPPRELFPPLTLEFADTFVFDAYSPHAHGGTGQTADWGRLAQLQVLFPHKRWFLAGGLKPANIAAALDASHATAIDVNSGVESAPGRKDLAKLELLIARARAAVAARPAPPAHEA